MLKKILVKPSERSNRIHSKDQNSGFLRHPLTLLFVGFILTDVVGTRIAHRLDEDSRNRATVVKQMDEFRSAVDDLGSASGNYMYWARELISAIEHGAQKEEVTKIHTQFDEASARWSEKAIADIWRIHQYLPRDTSVGVGIINALNGIYDISGVLNECIDNSQLNHNQMECTVSNYLYVGEEKHERPKYPSLAKNELNRFTKCIYNVLSIRPNPKNDFLPFSANDFNLKDLYMSSENALPICVYRTDPIAR